MATKEAIISYDQKKTTGQLLLLVGLHPTFEDGDILVAQNRKVIRATHAEHLCRPRIKNQKMGGMLYNNHPLLELLYQQGYQYKFARVSAKEVRRVNLWTLEVDMLSDKPNKKGEAINVELYLQRRKAANKKPLFGLDGAEIWYGGRTYLDHPKLDNVWNEIESRLGVLESDHADWPFTPTEKKRFLPVAVDDFDDPVRAELTSPLIDKSDIENPVTVKKRKSKIDWRTQLEVTEKDVEDLTKEVDLTNDKYLLSDVVSIKTIEMIEAR